MTQVGNQIHSSPCCLCLSEDESTFNLDSIMKSLPLHAMVDFCLGIQINVEKRPDQVVSTSICNECVLNINNFYTFKKRVLEAQELINGPAVLNEQQANDSGDDCFEHNEYDGTVEHNEYDDDDDDDEEFEIEEEEEEEEEEDEEDDGMEYSVVENVYIDENNDEYPSHHEQVETENNQDTLIQPVHHSLVASSIKKRPNNSTNASLPPPSPKKFRKNVKLSTQSSSEQFTLQINECLICPAIPGDILQLKDHIDTHQQIQCKACDRKFVRYSNLKRHFNAVHSKPKPFVCHDCGLGFNFEINLQSHTALHNSGKIQSNA